MVDNISFLDRLEKKKSQVDPKKIDLQTNSMTDGIFDLMSSFYASPDINVNDLYSNALSSYYKLLCVNSFSVLKSEIYIDSNLESTFLRGTRPYDSRTIKLTGEPLDNFLGSEFEFTSIVSDVYFSNTYNVKSVPSRQQIFDNVCNNFSNCILKYLNDDEGEIIFPNKKIFIENQNLPIVGGLLIENSKKVTIYPAKYLENGEIISNPRLDISQKEYEDYTARVFLSRLDK